MARPEHRRAPRLPQRLPEVVRAKRSVVADSFIVLRSLVRQLSERRTLARLVATGVVTIVGLVMLWRLLGHRGTGPVLGNRWPIMAVRQLIVLACQFSAAWWLTRRWTSPSGAPALAGVRRPLLRRLPDLAAASALAAWLDTVASGAASERVTRGVASFVLGYALSYAVPATAVYGANMAVALGRSYRAWRQTFRADLMAWSALWVLSGVVALIGAIPDAVDLYASGPQGQHLTSAGRLITILLVTPATLASEAIGGAFVAVILFALVHASAPPGVPTAATETVSGLVLGPAPGASDG